MGLVRSQTQSNPYAERLDLFQYISSTFSDGCNREETGGHWSGTVVDSGTTTVAYLCNNKSQTLSSNIFLNSAVGNNTDLVLPISYVLKQF